MPTEAVSNSMFNSLDILLVELLRSFTGAPEPLLYSFLLLRNPVSTGRARAEDHKSSMPNKKVLWLKCQHT